MNYDQLKAMPPDKLLQEIGKALVMVRGFMAIPELQRPVEEEPPKPILFLAGDFEIRARFTK